MDQLSPTKLISKEYKRNFIKETLGKKSEYYGKKIELLKKELEICLKEKEEIDVSLSYFNDFDEKDEETDDEIENNNKSSNSLGVQYKIKQNMKFSDETNIIIENFDCLNSYFTSQYFFIIVLRKINERELYQLYCVKKKKLKDLISKMYPKNDEIFTIKYLYKNPNKILNKNTYKKSELIERLYLDENKKRHLNVFQGKNIENIKKYITENGGELIIQK